MIIEYAHYEETLYAKYEEALHKCSDLEEKRKYEMERNNLCCLFSLCLRDFRSPYAFNMTMQTGSNFWEHFLDSFIVALFQSNF